MWIVLIGADADTFGACGMCFFSFRFDCFKQLNYCKAGPIIASYHPEIPENLLEHLKLKDRVEAIFLK